jgi:hypothetical protein
MPMIKIMESDVKTTEYTPLPEGFYEVYVHAYDEPEVMGDFERGSLLLKVRDDLAEGNAGRNIYVNLNTNPNIAWKLSNIARAAGVPAGTDFETLGDYFKAIKGKSMRIKLAQREYNGKIYPDVKAFYPTREKAFVLGDTEEDSII